MKIITTLIIGVISIQLGSAQLEYVGAGSTDGISVSASHSASGTAAEHTIDGSGLDGRLMDASRFLYQAGFGADYETVAQLAESQDYEGWIDYQASLSPTLVLPKMTDINAQTFQLYINRSDDDRNGDGIPDPNDPDDYFGPWMVHFSYAWWDNVKKAPDQLRYKVAHALSQILVISFNSDLSGHGEAVSSYFDVLLLNGLKNYKDILTEVSLHPAMGYYLSHLNNPRSNPSRNQHPDENYAREIMQLFTIGLYELNLDGSRKLDEEGNPIPTYDNDDIKELAKVFTGLGGGDLNAKIKREYPGASISFGAGLYNIDRTIPMRMWEAYHEPGQKTIVGDYVIPAGQSGLEDIDDAIEHLFQHDNVGPFIGRQLIQRLVKSNPSPDYIRRVAQTFNDNGSGVRGDMLAVIKAILLDPEARSCEALGAADHGKLREPILRHTHIMHALESDSPTGDYWKDPQSTIELMKQAPFASPTVFNFYEPDYQPQGDLLAQGLVAPEFQIFDSETAIGYVNQTFLYSVWELLMYDWEPETPNVNVVLDELFALSEDTEALLHRLDILFTHGQMTESTRQVIRDTLDELPYPSLRRERARIALYLTLISPDYTILK